MGLMREQFTLTLLFILFAIGFLVHNVSGACPRPVFINPYAIILDPDQESYNTYYGTSPSCEEGHTSSGFPQTIYCKDNGAWDVDISDDVCYAQCNITEIIQDDDIKATNNNNEQKTIFNHGEVPNFACTDKGQFTGSDEGTCDNGTLLVTSNPTCLAYCPVVLSDLGLGLSFTVADAPVINETTTIYYRNGDKVTYSCTGGYVDPPNCTSDDCTSTCDDGSWDPPEIPVCVEIDECSSTPCQNNATCEDRINGYQCQCAAGFNGTNCEENIDDCVGHPCLNGGICVDKIDSYECQCPDGFNGDLCDNEMTTMVMMTTAENVTATESGLTTVTDNVTITTSGMTRSITGATTVTLDVTTVSVTSDATAVTSTVMSDASSTISDASTVILGASTTMSGLSTVVSDASTTISDASSTISDASTVILDVTTVSVTSDATTVTPDTSTVMSDATTVNADVTTVIFDVTTITPDVTTAMTVTSDVTSVTSDVTTVTPRITTVIPDTTTSLPDTSTVMSHVSTVFSDASTTISDASTTISDASTVILDVTTAFSDAPISDASTVILGETTTMSDLSTVVSDVSTDISDASTVILGATTTMSGASTTTPDASTAISDGTSHIPTTNQATTVSSTTIPGITTSATALPETTEASSIQSTSPQAKETTATKPTTPQRTEKPHTTPLPCKGDLECLATQVCNVRKKTCECRSGYYEDETDSEIPCKEPVSIDVTLTITEVNGTAANFTEELNNSTSKEFKELESKVCQPFNEIYANDPEFVGCQVLNFSQGSIKVNYVLKFAENSTQNPSTVNQTIQDDLANPNGSFADEFIIDPDSLAVEPLNECNKTLDDCDENAKCIDEDEKGYTCECNPGYEDSVGSLRGRNCIERTPTEPQTTEPQPTKPKTTKEPEEPGLVPWKVIVGVTVPIVGILTISTIGLTCWQYRRQHRTSPSPSKKLNTFAYDYEEDKRDSSDRESGRPGSMRIINSDGTVQEVVLPWRNFAPEAEFVFGQDNNKRETQLLPMVDYSNEYSGSTSDENDPMRNIHGAFDNYTYEYHDTRKNATEIDHSNFF